MQEAIYTTGEGGAVPPSFVPQPVKWGLGLPFAVNTWERRNRVSRHAYKGPILQIRPPHERAAAVVGFGPSLEDTIDELKALDADIFTVSGAHDYLIERGIIPTGHVEIDPRAHKAKFLEKPHRDITYYLATGCDDATFANVEGHKLVVWNLYTYQDGDDAFFKQVHGPEAYSLDVGCSVGNAAMVVAGCLGYRNFHVFGMDCSTKGGRRHAAEHHGPYQFPCGVTLNGRRFDTTPQMIAAAQDFITLIARMGGPNFTIHGDGLLQSWIEAIMDESERTANV